MLKVAPLALQGEELGDIDINGSCISRILTFLGDIEPSVELEDARHVDSQMYLLEFHITVAERVAREVGLLLRHRKF